jgi:hypothetical protein
MSERRYCGACGSPMHRFLGRVDGWRYDARTGKAPRPDWWWGCSGQRDDGGSPYLDHTRSRRIKESGVRARLRERAG